MAAQSGTLKVSNQPPAIQQVIDDLILRDFSDATPRLRYTVQLVLTELMSNAYRHGNQSCSDKWIYFEWRFEAPHYEFLIADDGPGITLPDFTKPVDLLSETGRGLHLVHDLAQSLDVLPDGRTLRVVLTSAS